MPFPEDKKEENNLGAREDLPPSLIEKHQQEGMPTTVPTFPDLGDSVEKPKEKKENIPKEISKTLSPTESKSGEETKLPHIKKKNRESGKNKKGNDDSVPPHERGKYQQYRSNKTAGKEFQESEIKNGESSPLAGIDSIRFGIIDNKEKNSSKPTNEENEEYKWKTRFERARALESSSTDSEIPENAIAEYLKIITEISKENPIYHMSLYAISNLLFRKGEYKPAIDYLSKILQAGKNSKFYIRSLYLAGRITESWNYPGNLEKAAMFYNAVVSEKSDSDSVFTEDAKNRLNTLRKWQY